MRQIEQHTERKNHFSLKLSTREEDEKTLNNNSNNNTNNLHIGIHIGVCEMTQQLTLDFSKAKYFGSTYNAELDKSRLDSGLRKVHAVLAEGVFRSLREIEDITGVPQATASARFRTLGDMGFPTEKVRLENGLWVYRIRRD